MFKLLEEINQNITSGVNQESKNRELMEENLMKLLDEACIRLENAVRSCK